MAQIKVYGIADNLNAVRSKPSTVIHSCVMAVLNFPLINVRIALITLDQENRLLPGGRTQAYTIIEIMMIAGCTVETKKKLIRLLFDRIRDEVGIAHQDLEIGIIESPACNGGFRGLHGDELKLNYKINV